MMKMGTGKIFSLVFILLHLFLLTGGSGQVFAADDSPESLFTEMNTATPGPQNMSGDRVEGSWWDSQVLYTTVINFLGTPEYGFGTWVGYWQNAVLGHPWVNELYWLKVAVYGVGSPAYNPMYAGIYYRLPPNTQVDTSTYPVRCFGGPNMVEYTGGCPQTFTYDYINSAYMIPSGEYGNVWPVAAGAGWEFWIPVKTSTALSSVNFTGVIDNIEASNTPDKLYPTVPIWVFSGSTPAPGAFNKYLPADGAINIPISQTIQWYVSSNASTYEYCIDTSNDDECSPWVDISHPLIVLAPSTTYYWHVRALNAGGVTYSDGSPTAFWSFTTAEATQAPGTFSKSIPANNASNVSTDPTLEWAVSSEAKTYEYCYDTSNDGDCSPWEDNGLITSKTLNGLATETIYYWHVRAKNNLGTTFSNGSNSTFWPFTTRLPNAAPEKFNKAGPADDAKDISRDLTLTWERSDEVTSYYFCYDKTDNNDCTNWENIGEKTSKTLTGLDPNTTYYWSVRASNRLGDTYSDDSATAFWSFKTAAETAKPGGFNKTKPVDKAINISTSPTLSWGTSSGATAYEYCYDTTDDNACPTWQDNGTKTSKALTGLKANTAYYWHVRAKNVGGTTYSNGSSTAFWTFKTKSSASEDMKIFLPMILR